MRLPGSLAVSAANAGGQHNHVPLQQVQIPGPTKSRPEPSGRNRPDAARSRPDTARNSTVERSERNKSHTDYMLTTCSVSSFYHLQDEHGKMRKIMSLYVMHKLIQQL